MTYFILNNKRQRPHGIIYPLDNEFQGVPIYDYDDKQAARASNSDFQEMTAGSFALVFGKNLRVKDVFRVTCTKKKHASDLGKDVFVVYGEFSESLAESVRYRDFVGMNELSNPRLDNANNFRRGMLVAHVY
jgi:hypothetical protein